MSTQFLENLSRSISTERFNSYQKDNGQNADSIPYGRYFWNIALSESLYPGLQVLEVTLRNSLHEIISLGIGTEDWFDRILTQQDSPTLDEIKTRLTDQKIPMSVGQLVANSNLGFWVSLFNRRYESILWPQLLKDVFPYMPNSTRTRKNLSSRLNGIRRLRNRIFHYEPIWNRTNLGQRHDEILETIGWINPGMLEAVKLFDSFPEVYQSGVSHYEDKLSEYLAAKES